MMDHVSKAGSSILGKISRKPKERYSGATLTCQLQPAVAPGLKTAGVFSKYTLTCSPELETRLSPDQMKSLNSLVSKAGELTDIATMGRNERSRRLICDRGMKRQEADFKQILGDHLANTDIEISVVSTPNLGLDKSYCGCGVHNVDGLSVSDLFCILSTQTYSPTDRPGVTLCETRYMKKTPKLSATGSRDPHPRPSPSLRDPDRLGTFQRYCDKINTEIQTIVTRCDGEGRDTLEAIRDNQAACSAEVKRMIEKPFSYPGLTHDFDQAPAGTKRSRPDRSIKETDDWKYYPVDLDSLVAKETGDDSIESGRERPSTARSTKVDQRTEG